MSQDSPKPPASENAEMPASRTPVPKTEAQSQPQFWHQAQLLLRVISVSVLRGTIRILEFAVTKLEVAPPDPAQMRDSAQMRSGAKSPAGLAATPSAVTPPTAPAAAPAPATIAPSTPNAAPPLASPPPPPIPPAPGFFTELRLLWEDIQTLWGKVLPKIRVLLPASINQLSDSALTGAIAGVLVLLVWLSSAISGKAPEVAATPAPPPTVATRSTEAPMPEPAETLPELTAPAPEQPIAVSPVAKAIEPLPLVPPPLDLTPEQNLIAAIQDQVSDITNQYADGLIQAIQANFRSSRLTVRVNESWYGLARSRQDRLATEMLERARELDFSKLEITDSEGTLLARSPVVGSEMLIFKREKEGENRTDA